MTLFAVCCTVDMPAETVNLFLKTEYDENDKNNKDTEGGLFGERYLAVVTSLGGAPCTEPTIPPIKPGEVSSPFKDKSPEDCMELVNQEAKRDGAELAEGFFIILDERTIRDSTVLLVGRQKDNPVVSLRCRSGNAQSSLNAASISHPSIGNLVCLAEEEDDGVLKD